MYLGYVLNVRDEQLASVILDILIRYPMFWAADNTVFEGPESRSRRNRQTGEQVMVNSDT